MADLTHGPSPLFAHFPNEFREGAGPLAQATYTIIFMHLSPQKFGDGLRGKCSVVGQVIWTGCTAKASRRLLFGSLVRWPHVGTSCGGGWNVIFIFDLSTNPRDSA